MEDKIVITGIGMVTPLGIGKEQTWKNLIAGKSGIKVSSNLSVPVGQVLEFSGHNEIHRVEALAMAAAEEALEDAHINLNAVESERIACTVSVSKPEVSLWKFYNQETAGETIRKKFKIQGPCGNYTAACATGLVSIKAGIMYLLDNRADFCIAGSAESSLNDFYLAGFNQMGVLAKVDDNPEKAIKPFALDRIGFLPSEGAAVFILEKESSAQKRSAHIYAVIESCVIGNDGYHPVLFNANGKHIARVMQEAVIHAGWDPAEFVHTGYINAHGTATQLNDRLETLAFKYLFGQQTSVAISSTKAGTGHLLGAAASVETAFCALALRDDIIPPTLNLLHKDPACDLDYTPLTAQKKILNKTLSLSYGFGGHIGAIALQKM